MHYSAFYHLQLRLTTDPLLQRNLTRHIMPIERVHTQVDKVTGSQRSRPAAGALLGWDKKRQLAGWQPPYDWTADFWQS